MTDPATALWLPMTIAPKDRRIDLQAERYVPGHDRMRVEVFAGAKWNPGGTARRPAPYWRRLPTGWTAIGWRETSGER